MKLLVINSVGPMASTLVAAMAEKMGFFNFPCRKRGLHQYLLGKRRLSDPYFKNRTIEIINGFSVSTLSGGVSVLDRNSSKPIQRTDSKLIHDEIKVFLDTEFTSVSEMYFAANLLISKSMIYKKPTDFIGCIELTTDIETFSKEEIEQLSEAYRIEFSEVIFVSMRRDLRGWVNSLLSQKLYARKKQIKSGIVRLSGVIKRYHIYNKNISMLGGVEVEFDDLFIPNTFTVFKLLSDELSIPIPPNLQGIEYDLYGKLVAFDKAFTVFDDQVDYIGSFLRSFIIEEYGINIYSKIKDVFFAVIFLLRYLTRKSVTR